MTDIGQLLADIRSEIEAEQKAVQADPAAREREAVSKKHRYPDQIALHRENYRQAKAHVASIDAHNAANPSNHHQYSPRMLAYLSAFAYVEKDT